MLHIKRDGPVHSIQELEVSTQLTLATKKDYLEGDNSDIVATDSQKNTVYLLAKKYGITCPEEFAIILCRHFLTAYSHVLKVQVHVEQHPWQRAEIDGKEHNHAFISTPVATRVCIVQMERSGKYLIQLKPNRFLSIIYEGTLKVESGLKDLRVLKTTQSAFVNFVDDEYRKF